MTDALLILRLKDGQEPYLQMQVEDFTHLGLRFKNLYNDYPVLTLFCLEVNTMELGLFHAPFCCQEQAMEKEVMEPEPSYSGCNN